MSLTVNKIPGEIPEFWDRSVIFFANLLSLFYGNEKETAVLREEVGSLESYGSRLVPLIDLMYKGGNNLLVLEHKADSDLLCYFKQDLGLSLPEIAIMPRDQYLSLADQSKWIDRFKSYSDSYIDGYVTDNILEHLSSQTKIPIIASQESSQKGNNKLLLNQYLAENALPTFTTIIIESPDEVESALDQLKRTGYSKAVLKASIGASGIGMEKFELDAKFKGVDEYLFYEGPCLLQGWLDDSVSGVEFMGSPSVQLFVNEDTLNMYDLTEQILSDDSIHQGNIAPPDYLMDDEATRDEIFQQAEVVGRWLYNQGYRGTGSVDFHVIKRNERVEVRVCEINARVTGATYPCILARHFLPKGAWLMRNICFEPAQEQDNLLGLLQKENLLFKKGDTTGVLPFNFNPNQNGEIIKGQFLILGYTLKDVNALLEHMIRTKGLQGTYDRD